MDNLKRAKHLIKIATEKITPFVDGNNVIIGGTVALVLQGINIGREIDDIDIIIYRPTKKQRKTLAIYEELSKTAYYGSDKRTMKIQVGDVDVNIIKELVSPPDDLLYVRVPNGNFFPVQRVDNVIKAKSSYLRDSDSKESSSAYARKKDMYDLIELKNKNFNP